MNTRILSPGEQNIVAAVEELCRETFIIMNCVFFQGKHTSPVMSNISTENKTSFMLNVMCMRMPFLSAYVRDDQSTGRGPMLVRNTKLICW
jgi:hypothetical protein